MKVKEIFYRPRYVDISALIIIVLGAGTVYGCCQVSCVVKYAYVELDWREFQAKSSNVFLEYW